MLEILQCAGFFVWGFFFVAALFFPGVVKINKKPQSRLVGLLVGPFILLTIGVVFGGIAALILAPFTLFFK